MRLLTTDKERKIRMKPPRAVAKREKNIFSNYRVLMTVLLSKCVTVTWMLFFGNLLKESGVTKKACGTASKQLIDIVTLLMD
jgi:oxaloacetate decarboxylase beta subunit